jgi:hypothetical protein
MNITVEDKLRCVFRELKQRKSNYPAMIAEGTMSPAEAAKEIAVMECVVLDYKASTRGLGIDLSDIYASAAE